MSIKTVDLVEMGRTTDNGRKLLMDGPRYHAWLHVYFEPGQHDELHCHNADETFVCLEGECTVHFPDGSQSVLKPGTVALIPGGQFYQLENTGTGRMIMLGSRGAANAADKTISYETREQVLYPGMKAGEERPLPRGTQLYV